MDEFMRKESAAKPRQRSNRGGTQNPPPARASRFDSGLRHQLSSYGKCSGFRIPFRTVSAKTLRPQRWLIAAAVLLGAGAQAAELPQTIGLHLASVHAHDGKQAPGSYGWNNRNLGAYAMWSNGLTLGTFRNSLYRQSYYAGWTLSHGWFSLTIGAVTGYDRMVSGQGDYSAVRCDGVCREVQLKRTVLPLVAPSVRLPLTNSIGARLTLMAPPSSPVAVHLSVEKRF